MVVATALLLFASLVLKTQSLATSQPVVAQA
jgi:hypothetical protein